MKDYKETIRTSGLSTGYKSGKGLKVVTSNIEAALYSGELTCLLGPNGAGKSTLLRTLTAFQPPVEGTISVMGRDLSAYNTADLSRVIGVVLTDKVNVPNMSVKEIVGLGRSPYTGYWGRLSEADELKVNAAIRLVGVEHLKARRVASLSDGERQKVMIAKVLAQETPVIFLDEPTAFLDYPSKIEIMQLLRKLAREQGKTVFLSTHDLELALQIADKVWLLDQIQGLALGTPEDLSLNGELARYFQRAGMEFDSSTGLFKIIQKFDGCVTLMGEGERFNMVKKALARHGINAKPSAGSGSGIIVEILPDAYRIGKRTVYSIGDLLDIIPRLPSSRP